MHIYARFNRTSNILFKKEKLIAIYKYIIVRTFLESCSILYDEILQGFFLIFVNSLRISYCLL